MTRYHPLGLPALAWEMVGGVSARIWAALSAHTLTVNKDRLLNAQNEPQNWLMMNGDYGSTRYSKLTQINRDNVKNLRLVGARRWAACRTSDRTARRTRSIR